MKWTIVFVLLAFVIAVHAQTDSSNSTNTTMPVTSEPTTTITLSPPPNTTVEATTAHATTTAEVVSETTVPVTAPSTHATTTAKPESGELKFSYGDGNKTCILLQTNINITFSYKDDNNNTETMRTRILQSESDVTSGSCGAKIQYMTITFGPNKDVLSFIFAQAKDATYVQNITLDFTMDTTFPGINTTRKNQKAEISGTLYKGTKGMPYVCKSNLNKTLSSTDGTVVYFATYDFEFAAFRKTNNTEFNEKYVNCPEDSVTSNIVPIAVGAALAALVVIVLIAYLISRNRNKRGYESV